MAGRHYHRCVHEATQLSSVNARNTSFFCSHSEVTADPARRAPPAVPAPPPLIGSPTGRPRKRTHAFSSYFYKVMCVTPARYAYDSVRNWTTGPLAMKSNAARVKGKVSVLDYNQLLMPVNACGVHWALAVVDICGKEFVYMDSLPSSTAGRRVLAPLRRWFADEVTDKYGDEFMRSLEIGTWKTVVNPTGTPRQTDADSCGMFCLALAERCELGRSPDFSQADMPVLRKRAALALHNRALPES